MKYIVISFICEVLIVVYSNKYTNDGKSFMNAKLLNTASTTSV